jgi:hypothetical protein
VFLTLYQKEKPVYIQLIDDATNKGASIINEKEEAFFNYISSSFIPIQIKKMYHEEQFGPVVPIF